MMAGWRDWEGQVIAEKYRLQKYLGGHQNSAVFATESEETASRTAAIKLVPEDPATAELQLTRWREAAHLSHPHLLRLFDSGRCQLGDALLLYVVMERAEDDLSQVLPDRPLTAEEVRDLLRPALEAVGYLHGAGFVHGHLGPTNILSVGDQLKISGDPLYRTGEPANRLGRQGPVDPPEKARGAASPAWDTWSLGVTLVEAFTQRPPALEGATPAIPETLPEPFREIALGCLAGDPARRWTLADIAARLEGRPLPAVTPGGRRVLPIAAAGVAIAVAIGFGLRMIPQGPAPAPAPSVASETPVAPAEPPRLPPPSSQKSTKKKAAPENRAAPPSPPAVPKGRATGGEVVQQILPDVLPKARSSITGKVKIIIKVSVDESGNVSNAASTGRGASKYFTDLAAGAARKWTFRPPQVDGRGVPSEWLLRFEFTRAGTKVSPERTAP